MAELEIGPLTDRLSDEEITDLASEMEKLGASPLPHADDTAATTVGGGLDDSVLGEFFDLLEVYDVAAEIYLPVEFEGSVEVAHLRVASAPLLLDVLEEIKDDLGIDEDEADEDEVDEDEVDEAEDDDEDRRLLEAHLRQVWKLFYSGAQVALERHLPLHVKP
jgi:hypothetical protein